MRQRTLTRPEHLVLPFLHSALMFVRSTCYAIFSDFGFSIDYSIGQRIVILKINSKIFHLIIRKFSLHSTIDFSVLCTDYSDNMCEKSSKYLYY